MSNIDHLDLSGHLLLLLLAVYEERSVTRAALRLDMTQSAVSHGLDRLRAITGDALFVRAGRGIAATAQAHLLAERAGALLEGLREFGHVAHFDPAGLSASFTIAANDLQRDLLLPALARRLHAQAPGVSVRVINSGAPQPELLRGSGCDLVITPRPPDASDIVQQRLFGDRYCVFFDPAHRAAPASAAEYLAAEHVTVLYEPGRVLDVDRWMQDQGVDRRFAVRVPGMGALGAMLRGGPWIATAPSLLGAGVMRDLASAPVPVPTPPFTMYMVWHQRHHADPVHRWLRANVLAAMPPGLREED